MASPGKRTRTEGLPPSGSREPAEVAEAALERIDEHLNDLSQRADRLAQAIQQRNFAVASEAVGLVDIFRRSLASQLGDAERAAAQAPELVAQVEAARARAEAVDARLDALLPLAPEPDRLYMDLTGEVTARREAAWLARLGEAGDAGADSDDNLASAGEDVPDRAAMEGFFGESFADVRVQRDAAAELAPLGAAAITDGESIAFADAEPSPALVAHELAHVVQNRRAGNAGAVMAAGLVAPESCAAEAEAEGIAERVTTTGLAGPPPVITAAPSAAIHRASIGKARDQASAADKAAAGLRSSATSLVVMPRSLLFAPTLVGHESAPQRVAVTNPGPGAVVLADVIEGPVEPGRPRFRVYGETTGALAPGETTTIDVAFAPSVAGFHDATLHVLTADGASSAQLRVIGDAQAEEVSQRPRLKAEPDELELLAPAGEESVPATIRLENPDAHAVRVEDIQFGDGRRSEFVAYGADAGDVPAGGTMELAVAFRPRQRAGHVESDSLRVIGAGGATAARVKLRGRVIATPAVENFVRDLQAERVDFDRSLVELADRVDAGELPAPPRTYAEMRDAVRLAARLVERKELSAASQVIGPVAARLEEILTAEHLDELKRGRNGAAKMDIDVRIDMSRTAVHELRRKAIGGEPINIDHLMTRFEYGREVLLCLTGEQKRSAELDGLNEASQTALRAHMILYGAAVFAPALVAMTPSATAAISARSLALFWELGGPALQGLRTWVALHPFASMALTEVAAGMALNLGENGLDGFLAQLQTGEGILMLLVQVGMDYAGVKGASYDDAAIGRPRLPQGGVGLEPTPTPTPTGRRTADPGADDAAPDPVVARVDEIAKKYVAFVDRVRAARDAEPDGPPLESGSVPPTRQTPDEEPATTPATAKDVAEGRVDTSTAQAKAPAEGVVARATETTIDEALDHHLAIILPPNARRVGQLSVVLDPDTEHPVTVRIAVVDVRASDAPSRVASVAQGVIEVRISNKLAEADVGRTLAGSLAQAQALSAGGTDGSAVARADIRFLLAHLDEEGALPGHGHAQERLRRETDEALRDAGIDQSAAGRRRTKELFHDQPEVARRVELHLDGLSARPNIDASGDASAYLSESNKYLGEVRQRVTGEGADELVAVEGLALGAQLRLEDARRLFDPLNAQQEALKPHREAIGAVKTATKEMTAIINNASLSPQQRATALVARIARLEADPRLASHKGDIDFGAMRRAATTLGADEVSASGGLVLDVDAGILHGGATGDAAAPGTVRQLMSDVDIANQTAAEHGLGIQYVIVMHSPQTGADGRNLAMVEVISRPLPRYRRPIGSSPVSPAHNAADELTIDVGVGRGNFAAEKLPDEDRGELIVQSEHIGLAMAAQGKRHIAGTADGGPLQIPGAVVVYGDVLQHPELLGRGPGDAATAGIRRVFLNNVSAHYGPEQYEGLAKGLGRTLADDGIIEVQWDKSPENTARDPRGHIEGPALVEALKIYSGRQVIVDTDQVPEPYAYTLNTGATAAPDPAKLRAFTPPTPGERWRIQLGPRTRTTAP